MNSSVFQKTAVPVVPTSSCLIHELFLAQASRTPENTAVVCSHRTLRYRDLLLESRSLAHRLREMGTGPNRPVAVVMDKGWEQIAAVLAILESGAPYLPIDPTVPKDRLRYLLRDGDIEVVMTQSWLDCKLDWPSGVNRISVDLETAVDEELHPLKPIQTPDDLAYVLYTSGSTGTPKGVMIGHRGIVNCILETNQSFHVNETDRVLAITALHHDMSVFDIFGMLASGGAIVIPDQASSRAPDHWLDLMRRHRVTIWNSVPSFLQMLLDYADIHNPSAVESLRLAFLGGDWIPLSTPSRTWDRFGDVEVVSVGGPTETTLWNIWYPIRQIDRGWKSIPYGHAIANTRYYVLDESLQECPVGAAGELWCAGVGLMRGYWRDEEQTSTKFAVHAKTGERIYRTGDRGRWHPDGEIEFLGRMDTQVKILGQRIELGEIETLLNKFPGIQQAVAKVVTLGGQQRLAAYVATGMGQSPNITDIRAYLERQLPCHMVPTAIELVKSLPLSANGKVDRDALPTPHAWMPATPCSMTSTSGFHDPIQSIWREALNLEQVGVDDNFFDLGGNSLLLVQVHGALRKRLGLNMPVTALFEFPTIRALRLHVEALSAGEDDSQEMEVRTRSRRMALARRRSVVNSR
jgi:amino acid adenylation domain-containing protein